MGFSAEKEGQEGLKNAILIAGPTASGKSALAIEIARAVNGVVINADSMQVYDVLSLLTARPDAADLEGAVHRLYGHVNPADHYSTGHWLADVAALAEQIGQDGQRPIFVGGTGLYFRALTEGLSPMPQVPAELRAHWRSRLQEEGPQALHRVLGECDPVGAASIRPSDGQRIVRALEVFEASGRPIGSWQGETSRPLVDAKTVVSMVLAPDRAFLAERIDMRFERMIGAGALDEVRALRALDIPPDRPVMKAIGVPELGDVLDGTLSLEEAMTRAKTATRRYAKRQMTWFRNQFGPEWHAMPIERGMSVRDIAGLGFGILGLK